MALKMISIGEIPGSNIPTSNKWAECVLSDHGKEELIRICKDADLHAISKSSRFPDWLGCMGIVLHHLTLPSVDPVSGQQPDCTSLSDNWSKQLLLILGQNSETQTGRAHGFLSKLLNDSDLDLQWQHLEILERDLRAASQSD